MMRCFIQKILLLSVCCFASTSHAVPVTLTNVNHITSAIQVTLTKGIENTLQQYTGKILDIDGSISGFTDSIGTAGAGFSNKTSGGTTAEKVANSNPMKGYVDNPNNSKAMRALKGGQSELSECGQLTDIEAIRKCYYADRSVVTSSSGLKDILDNVTTSRKTSIQSLFANAASVVNRASEFEQTRDDVTRSTNTTVSKALRQRSEEDLMLNVYQTSHFSMDIAAIQLNAFDIYVLLNDPKLGQSVPEGPRSFSGAITQ